MKPPPSPSKKEPDRKIYRYIGEQDECFGLLYRVIDTSKPAIRDGDEWKYPPWPFEDGEVFLRCLASEELTNIGLTNIADTRKQKQLDPAFKTDYLWAGNKKQFKSNFEPTK